MSDKARTEARLREVIALIAQARNHLLVLRAALDGLARLPSDDLRAVSALALVQVADTLAAGVVEQESDLLKAIDGAKEQQQAPALH